MKADRLVDKNGQTPEHFNQRLYDNETGRLCQKGLAQFVAMFPTPDANCGNRVPAKDPTATHRPSGSKRQVTINDAVKLVPTPTARDWKSGKGKTQSERGRTAGPSLAEVSGGQLNPMWVEWLMGFPLGWTDLEDSETQ
jgi:hypothetical protein